MNRMIELKLLRFNYKNKVIIKANGKRIKMIRNNYGNYESNINVNSEYMDLEIISIAELDNPLWWIFSLITFIISIGGILEPKYSKNISSFYAHYYFYLNDTNTVKIAFDNNDINKAVNIESNLKYDELENYKDNNKSVKVKYRILCVFRLLFWVVLIISLIIYLV